MLTHTLATVQRRRLAAALACLFALVLAWRHVAHRQPPATPQLAVAPVRAKSRRGVDASRSLVVVDVAGAVRRPGVYRLPRGARVADAVARAGGLTRRAARTAVNLAALLADGQQVLVAARGSPTAVASGQGEAPGAGSGPVSLSSATAEQLDALPGVGPVTAQKIIQYREEHGSFTSVDQLDAIPGIGPARLRDLQGLVVP